MRFLRVHWLALCIVAGALAGSQGCTESRDEATPRPNVLLISVCSVRADHLGCYGRERPTSPNIDKLAEKSIVFENAFTQWPKTMPAFASLMTGMYGHSTGIMRVTPGQHLDDEFTTLAEALREEGYATAAFLTSAALNPATNIVQGFDVADHADRIRSAARYAAATDLAIDWMGKRPAEKPFFVWVHYNSTHVPYKEHGVDPEMFVGDAFMGPERTFGYSPPIPFDLPPDYPNRKQILRPDVGGSRLGPPEGETASLNRAVAIYDAAVFATDRWVGELMAGLDATGALDNTVIALVGDHGEALGEHDYFFEHGRFPYDDCMRVPLIIRLPDQERARRVAAPVAASSLMATLLDLVGTDVPEQVEIGSLAPGIDGGSFPPYVFSESGYHPDYMTTVRDERWKLTHVPNEFDRRLQQGAEYELYDVQRDPAELDNRVAAEPQVLEELRAVLDAWAAPWRAAAYNSQSDQADIDETVKERLRALGYPVD